MEQKDPLISVTSQLQNLLHNLIEPLANGALLTRRHKVLFPTCYNHSRVKVKKELKELYILLRNINTTTGRPEFCKKVLDKLKIMTERAQIDIDEFLIVISSAYQIFSELVHMIDVVGGSLKPNPVKIGQFITPSHIAFLYSYKERDLSICKELEEYVKREMARYLVGFYVHGSVSTLDFTDFSDLDTVLILKEETVSDPQKLKEFVFYNIICLCYLYRFQNLHHHGNMILTEQDIRYYNQAVLPCEVFKYARALCGKTELEFNCRDTTGEHIKVIHSLLTSLNHYLSKTGLCQRNIWHFRYFIGTILILPVLYLEVLGVYVYKKFSFKEVRRHFSDNWEAVSIAEEIRKRWVYFPTVRERFLVHSFLKKRKNPLMFSYLMARVSQYVPNQLQEFIDQRFMEKCISFSDEFMHKIEQLKTQGV